MRRSLLSLPALLLLALPVSGQTLQEEMVADLSAVAEKYISLATFRKNGNEVKTPVWFAAADDRLWVFTAADSGKVKRLRNSDRIRIAACNARGKVHGDWIEGHGRRVEDAGAIEAAYAALRAKYGWQMHLADFFSRLTGRFDKRAILELEV